MFLTVVHIISFIIFGISCVPIWHNTNAYEPRQRVFYIIVGNIVIYIITSIICGMQLKGITSPNQGAIDDTTSVMKWIFTPLNSMFILSTFGNIFGKAKDKTIDADKAGKYLTIAVIIFIIIFIFESNYIGGFIRNSIATLAAKGNTL